MRERWIRRVEDPAIDGSKTERVQTKDKRLNG